MPLKVEAYNPHQGRWYELPYVNPGGHPGSISDSTSGGREIYVFECARDDSQSVISRSKGGIDVEIGAGRQVTSEKFLPVATLRNNESHVLDVGLSGQISKVRFTHVKQGP